MRWLPINHKTGIIPATFGTNFVHGRFVYSLFQFLHQSFFWSSMMKGRIRPSLIYFTTSIVIGGGGAQNIFINWFDFTRTANVIFITTCIQRIGFFDFFSNIESSFAKVSDNMAHPIGQHLFLVGGCQSWWFWGSSNTFDFGGGRSWSFRGWIT